MRQNHAYKMLRFQLKLPRIANNSICIVQNLISSVFYIRLRQLWDEALVHLWATVFGQPEGEAVSELESVDDEALVREIVGFILT